MKLIQRQFQIQDKRLLIDLYRHVWPESFTGEHQSYLTWAFINIPSAQSLLFWVAEDQKKQQLAAARPSLYWPLFSCDGLSLRSFQLGGTAVHPDYRRRGLFTQLTERLLASMADTDADCVFNVSVPAARKGYEKLGWRYLSGMRRYIYFNATAKNIAQIIRSPHSLRRQPSSPIRSEFVLPDSIADFLEARHEFLRGRFYSELDAARLKWRLSKPSEGYRVLFNEQHGLCIYKIDQLPTHKEVLIGEIIPLNSSFSATRYFKREILRRESPLLMSMILTGGHPLRRSLILNGFLPDPRRELNFGVRKINPRLNDDILFDPNKWALATWDIDTF